MMRLFVSDEQGWITADVAASGPALQAGLDHPQAEAVIRCAVLMALCALAEGGSWPDAALQCMSAFMEHMRGASRHATYIELPARQSPGRTIALPECAPDRA